MVVTTAVQFFETLAAKETTALRKLHQLPGSAIFVDETHAAMPAQKMESVPGKLGQAGGGTSGGIR